MQKRLKSLRQRFESLWPGHWLIKQRLNTAGILLSVLALATPIYMWNKLQALSSNYTRTSYDWAMLGKIHEFNQFLTDSESKLRAFATSGDREWLNTITTSTRSMDQLLSQMQVGTADNPYRATLVRDTREVFREWFTNVVLRNAQRSVKIEKNKINLDQFAKLLMSEPLAVRMHRMLNELTKDIHDGNMIATRSVLHQSRQTMLMVTYGGIFFFVGFAGLMLSLWYTIIPGLNALLVSARELKKGNLDYRVQLLGRSETAELGRAFNEMAVSLKAQNEKLKELNRMKSDFVSTVSHELRTPLTAIKGSIGLILGEVTGTIPGETRQMLQITEKNTDRLIRLINEVLDIAKIEAGAIEMQFDKHSLIDAVSRAVQGIETVAHTQGIKLVWEKPLQSPLVVIDHDRVEQVITNLLSNAIKFTAEGGTVKVECELLADQAIVKVSDTGYGISSEFLEKIFEKFQQAEESKNKATEGTGLGLAIAKAIVEEHGGRIWVESTLHSGSTFFFSLPWNGTDFVEQRKPAAALAPSQKRNTILIVDDEADFTTVLQMMLEHQGYDVVVTNSSRAALALAVKHRPDLVLLDVIMPDMDGFAVKQLLGSVPETRDIPVAIVSISPDLSQRADELKGVVKIFPKPIVPETLNQWLADFFASAQKNQNAA